MTYDPTSLFDALQSVLASAGFRDTLIAEPSDPPAQPTAVVLFTGVTLDEHELAASSGVVRFNLRFYFDALEMPQSGSEKEIARVTLLIISNLAANFDLDLSDVRNVEPGMEARAGFQTISGKWYRVVDLAVGVRVNDIATWTK